MNKIKDFLDEASIQYYAGSPIITDEQFDTLAESIGYSAVGAPQHEDTSPHYHRMYSLQKYYVDEGAVPLPDHKNKSMTPKLDGAAVSLLYVNGALVQALTRGDGVEGKIVTQKFLNTKLVPTKINHKGILQVSGEVCAPKHVENARNYAAGALNLNSVDEFRTRSIEFFAYGVYPYLTEEFTSDLQALKKLGFSTVQDRNLSEIYPTDGLVFRVNNNADFDVLGHTSKHPRGAYAQKERSAHVETTLLSVEWQVGKSGKVTPVAILTPVLIGDALVSRATLNNGEFIKTLDLRIGDRVAVRRAGEIIPQVLHKVE